MWDSLGRTLLLAVDPAPAPPGGGGGGGPEGILSFAFPLLMIVVIFYFIMFRPQQREKKKADEMLKALKKNDRVVTIGGIIATIANIEPGSDVVTLKLDDNTRVDFLRSAIQRPWSEKEAPAAKETTK